MTFNFKIINAKSNLIRLITDGLFLINAFLFLFFAIKSSMYNWTYIPAIISIIVTILSIFFKKRNKIIYLITAIIICVAWIQLSYAWLGIIMIILLSIAERIASDTNICFTSSEIIITSFSKRKFQWNDLQNVVLKDGLLTIDFKNNKLLQVSTSNLINEKMFNDFCKNQLSN
ncbi:MAG: hypothetical protein LC122_04705 [Chitinophagales bacterium]|nr:hypothetical protein [Chitinophagales bacterium]